MKIVLIIVICIIAFLLLIYGYYGGFKKIVVKIETQGGETVVYEEIKGDYRQSGVVMDKIYYSLLENDNVETYKGFGKYFDNPKKVEVEKLRSQAGSIIEEKDLDKIDRISGGFKTMELPRQKYLTTEYPYKNKISVIFSLMRVYPALNKFATENGFKEETPVIEIYDIPNKKIIYRKEVEYQK